jgi:hypothetical protein
MKVTLVQAAQMLGISAPLLRWRIRHHRVLPFVGRKPATVEIGPVVNRNVFCALADGFNVAPLPPIFNERHNLVGLQFTHEDEHCPTDNLLGSRQVPEPVEQPVDDQALLPPCP